MPEYFDPFLSKYQYGFRWIISEVYEKLFKWWQQRVKTNYSFSNQIDVLYGISQGSILTLARYANDNTPYVMNKLTNEVVWDMNGVWMGFYLVLK